jgi:hypothetical protein
VTREEIKEFLNEAEERFAKVGPKTMLCYWKFAVFADVLQEER